MNGYLINMSTFATDGVKIETYCKTKKTSENMKISTKVKRNMFTVPFKNTVMSLSITQSNNYNK